MYTERARGIRKSSAVINTVAAPGGAATAVLLYQRTTGGQNPRTVILRKIMAFGGAANAVLEIGTGGLAAAPAFANLVTPVLVVAGHDGEWTEDDLPEVEVGADLTMECDVDDIMVQIEIEEIE